MTQNARSKTWNGDFYVAALSDTSSFTLLSVVIAT